jgi:hypothetical protein
MILHKIFIDDTRQPSNKHKDGESWILCESYQEFKEKINELLEKKEWISEISFDYILGYPSGYDGASCFKLLARTIHEHKLPIPEKIYVHSEFPNCEKYFKSVAMSLSHRNDVDVDLIRVHENGTQTVLKTWE